MLLRSYSKGKGKGLPVTGHESPEGEQMYSSTLPSTLALDGGVGGQHHAPAALPRLRPGTHCTGGWVSRKGLSARMRKMSTPTGIRSPDRPARSSVAISTELSLPTDSTVLTIGLRNPSKIQLCQDEIPVHAIKVLGSRL